MSARAGSMIGRAQLPGGGRVLFTDRSHGNMSSVGGEDAANGERARERLRRLIGVDRLAHGHQVHGSVVRRVAAMPGEGRGDGASMPLTAQARSEEAADGQATAIPGVGAMVLSADCLPVALGCTGAVAMVHAGWRGLAAGVLEEGVLALGQLGEGDEIAAIVGPGAGVCCYEVGPEVHAAFDDAHRQGPRIDLRAIARDRLLAAGVARVQDVAVCTICDRRFFSHRREGERAGRQAGVAWLS